MSAKPTPPPPEIIQMGVKFPFVPVASPVRDEPAAASPLSRRLVGIALVFFMAGFWVGLIAHAVRGVFGAHG